MATVELDRDDFEEGALPPVCALTGGAADDAVTMDSRRLPPWWPLLLFLGAPGVAAVAVIYALRESVRGSLPVDVAAWERYQHERTAKLDRLARRAAVLVGGAGALAVLAAQIGWLGPAEVLAVLAAAAVVAGLLLLPWWPDVQLSRPKVVSVSGGRLTAENVHAEFARAVRDQRRTGDWMP